MCIAAFLSVRTKPKPSFNLPLRPVFVEPLCPICMSRYRYGTLLHRNDFVTILLYYSNSNDQSRHRFYLFVLSLLSQKYPSRSVNWILKIRVLPIRSTPTEQIHA